jgi:hypothetical protein
VLLISLYLCLYFSRIVSFPSSPLAQSLADYAPPPLTLIVIAVQLWLDRSGAILSTLSALSVLLEVQSIPKNAPLPRVFWSYQRFVCAALAVWVAITHQSRDIYLVFCYGMFGFFAGLMTYMAYLLRQGVPCKHDMRVYRHMWVGVCVVLASFLVLIQQHWYSGSPMRSTVVSVPILLISCLQCLYLTPEYIAPPVLQLWFGVILVSLCFGTVALDLLIE